jgi:hypothetical protein
VQHQPVQHQREVEVGEAPPREQVLAAVREQRVGRGEQRVGGGARGLG